MKALHVCAELYPFIKTGGLADATAGLAAAFASQGCEVRLLLPAYPALTQAALSPQIVGALPAGPRPWGAAPAWPAAEVVRVRLPDLAAPVYLLQSPDLYARPGSPYLDSEGHDWADNALRFAALGWAGACLGQGLDAAWVPDVLHGHDWHAGLMPAYVRAFADAGQATPATVFTLHNLAYQGLFAAPVLAQLGLPPSQFTVDGLEFHGQVSFMKAALRYADRITTVSPTYAREICTPAQGCGLDGLLRERAGVLSGVLNGVDYTLWNPGADAHVPAPYDALNLAPKRLAKRALQSNFGLVPRAQALLFGVVSRLTPQKGLHLLPQVLADVVQLGGQLALMGQGDAALEQVFEEAARQFPGQVSVRIGYDEASAHRVIAGADVIVVPSAFEPCGLTQLYGLRYGTLPLVRRVGGLADTVVDCTLENLADGSATGFVFDELTAASLHSALRRAAVLFGRPALWRVVQRRGMGLRFDWASSAQLYLALYRAVRPLASPPA